MRRAISRIIAPATLALLLVSCGKKEDAPPPASAGPAPAESAKIEGLPSSEWTDASADFFGPAGETMGSATFRDGLGGVLIRIEVSGLAPGWHGVHLHMVGDCSDGADGFKASGGHINPDGREHGLLNPNGSHRSDLPNLFADGNGGAKAELFRAGVHLKPSEEAAAMNGPFPLMDDDGFAVIIHESPDDHMTQPIGGAGARVACAAVK